VRHCPARDSPGDQGGHWDQDAGGDQGGDGDQDGHQQHGNDETRVVMGTRMPTRTGMRVATGMGVSG